jgi:hypothetical protein
MQLLQEYERLGTVNLTALFTVSGGRAIQGVDPGGSLSGVASSNLSGDMDASLLWVLCVVM